MDKNEKMMRIKVDTLKKLEIEKMIRKTKSLSETLDELIAEIKKRKKNKDLYGMLGI